MLTIDSKDLRIIGFVPSAAEEFAVEADQEGSHPEDEEDIDEVLLVERVLVDDSHGDGKEEADDHGSPEIPLAEVVDALLPVAGQHEDDVAYLVEEGQCFLDLSGGSVTIILRALVWMG